ncbi:MAG: hypothetical protein SVX28_06430 [Pseudomonadota bacterium]|nr:hypothetical protein [Pseudomonadota bacterium]
MNEQHETWQDEPPAKAGGLSNFDMMHNLPALLRILGTAALLIAMYSFLVKGWQSGNDVFRYMLMLGHTGILAAVGIASGHWLKESKGARLLLTLALVSVPVNFAILGALIFSQSFGIDASHYPHYVAWSVDSLNTALFTSAGAMVLLIPVTLLGFTVLVRSLSRKLSVLFLLSNVVLLLPIRDPHLIGLFVLALTFISLVFNYRISQGNIATRTREGIIALGLQFLPLGILMGRSLWLYDLDMFLLTVLAITVFYVLRQASMVLENNSTAQNLLNATSLVPAVIAMPLLSDALLNVLPTLPVLVIPLAGLFTFAMVYDIAQRSSAYASGYRYIASAILVLGMLLNLNLFTGLIAALLAIAVGLGLVVLGFQRQQRSVFTSGVVLMLVGMGQQLYELVHHFDFGSWASLATLGVISIVIASTIESQGGKIKPRIDNWKASFKQWEK